jgi:hypothetical protein
VKRALQVAALTGGAAGFVLLVRHAGTEKLVEGARAFGVGTLVFVALAGFEHALHAFGWQRCFAPERTPRWRPLFEAYLAGYAFSLVTPTTAIGGDVLRASLVPPGATAAESAAAVTADRLACSVSDALVGLVGVVLLFGLAPLAGWHELALAGATLALGAGIAIFFAVQRSGTLAGWVAAHPLVAKLGGEALASRAAHAARSLDAHLRELHRERPGAFRSALLRNLAATLVGAAQVALFLAWLDEPAVLESAAIVFFVGVALDLFSFFIPARIGAQEGSRMLGTTLAGLDPSLGLLLSLLLRVEQLIWAGIGLFFHGRISGLRRAGGEPV